MKSAICYCRIASENSPDILGFLILDLVFQILNLFEKPDRCFRFFRLVLLNAITGDGFGFPFMCFRPGTPASFFCEHDRN
jgi:hypothetical protein